MVVNRKSKNVIYDVAFSFAGEQREYVSKVYNILANEYDVKVFYDQDERIQADLWGKDLVEELQKIYRDQSKWCVLFISKEYKNKIWTKHEKRSVLERTINEKRVYLLPARFDDTEISGIPITTSYIDISNMTPEDFSKYILRKLEIPIKEREKTSDHLNLPDIRVSVNYAIGGFAVKGLGQIGKMQHFLSINVSNHGNVPVFLKQPKIKLKNGIEHIPIFEDDIFGKTISEIGKLEPGDLFNINSDPQKYINYINKLDYVAVDDKIGREFKNSPEELNEAIKAWNESRSKC